MLPPIEKENAETDMDSDASDDMKDGLVHHLQRRLLNSTCDWTKEINRNLWSHGLLYLHGPTLRILKEKIVGQISIILNVSA